VRQLKIYVLKIGIISGLIVYTLLEYGVAL
jgi:hypothetical protein